MKITDSYAAGAAAYNARKYPENREGTFADKLNELKSSDRLEISGTSRTNTADMSSAEYKAYIYGKFSSMKTHPSRRNDFISVNISESGLEAMKNDPEYERWVLDTVQRDLLQHNAYSDEGGMIDIMNFGASKEEYGELKYNAGLERANEKKYEEQLRESLRELRLKREKMYKKLAEKHRLQEKELQEMALAEKLMKEKNIYGKKALSFTFSAAKDIFLNMDTPL